MDFDFLTPPPEERIIRTNNLTEEQVKDLEMAFSLFDDQDLKVIPIKQLRQLMRAVGQNPSDVELQDISAEIDADGSGELYLSDFLYIMSQRYENMTTEDEIIAAFRVFYLPVTLNKKTNNILCPVGPTRMAQNGCPEKILHSCINAPAKIQMKII